MVKQTFLSKYFTDFQTKTNGQPGLYLLVQELTGNEVTHEDNDTQVGNLQNEATAFSNTSKKGEGQITTEE